MEGASSFAAMRARGGAAGRRLAARRLGSPSVPGLAEAFTATAPGGCFSSPPFGALLGRGGLSGLGRGMDAASGGFLVSPGRATVLNLGRALAGFGICPSAPIGRAGRGASLALEVSGRRRRSSATLSAVPGRLRGKRNRPALDVAVVSHSPSNFGAANARTPAPTHSAFAPLGTGDGSRKAGDHATWNTLSWPTDSPVCPPRYPALLGRYWGKTKMKSARK